MFNFFLLSLDNKKPNKMNYQFVPVIFRPMYNFGNNRNFSYFKYGNPLIVPSSPIDIKIPHGFEKKQQNIISDLNCSSTPFSPGSTPNFFEFDDTEIFLLEEPNLKESIKNNSPVSPVSPRLSKRGQRKYKNKNK